VYVADIAGVIHLAKNTVDTRQVADDDIVIDVGDTIPSMSAYANVVAGADATQKRQITDGSVVDTVDVTLEGTNTVGHVVEAGGVGNERMETGGRVGIAAGLILERTITDSRAAAAGGVIYKGECSNGCVVNADVVE
jgi:hypothetical protein